MPLFSIELSPQAVPEHSVRLGLGLGQVPPRRRRFRSARLVPEVNPRRQQTPTSRKRRDHNQRFDAANHAQPREQCTVVGLADRQHEAG